MDAETDDTTDEEPQRFYFFKGRNEVLGPKEGADFDWDQAADATRQNLTEALNARNLSFLLGSGCSSLQIDGKELGIPTMAPLAHSFLSTAPSSEPEAPTDQECDELKKSLGISVRSGPFRGNLERLMEVLYSTEHVLGHCDHDALKDSLPLVRKLIQKTTNYICRRCREGEFSREDQSVVSLYQAFYRQLLVRDRTLPRPWVFTTNYDLFNEQALDRMGMPYCNGFSGAVERRFNPASFRYALAEQLDVSSRKWTAVDGYIYLCKLHGSINWIAESSGLFPVREVSANGVSTEARVMIYPTPAKQSASFASPYSDLIREFQSRIVREQSVLVVLGYGFADEHINNLIFQALTVPTFRLIAFVDPDSDGPVKELRRLEDPRVWLIGGDGATPRSKAHYFDTFVTRFMPSEPGNAVNEAIARVLSRLVDEPAGQNKEASDEE